MNSVGAWLLNCGGGQLAAVGLREVLHIASTPALATIPQTPPHCCRALVIEKRVVPVWDVAAWLCIASPLRASPLAAIVGYQKSRRAPVELGALLVAEPPVRIMVSDDDSCALPATPARWRAIATSCFGYHGHPVPILDLRLMFSDALSAGRSTAAAATESSAEVELPV